MNRFNHFAVAFAVAAAPAFAIPRSPRPAKDRAQCRRVLGYGVNGAFCKTLQD